MLQVIKLDPRAIVPTVAHPGEDLGFDLYALERAIVSGYPVLVRTGIAATFQRDIPVKFGLLIRDRSSLAARGVFVMAGVVDAGYRGEIKVLMSHVNPYSVFSIQAGDKIAQMIPISVQTGYGVIEVPELAESARGTGGFGSSGR